MVPEGTTHEKLQVLYLYTEIPALRSQDYINTSFNSKNSTHYINLNKKELIIKEGKTTNKTNTRIIDIPDIVITIIKISNSIWLIPKLKNTNEHMNNSSFTKFLNNLFGKSISSSRLRNIFSSYYNDSNLSIEERRKNANVMAHSLKTQQTVYTKYSQKLHEKDVYIKKIEDKNKELRKRIKLLESKLS